ncbi:MAG: cupin domain-containing protein [Anaerolineae bacterium]
MCDDHERPWEPEPIPAEAFDQGDGWVNINRAPYDEISGVIYKRAANVKRVAYTPPDQSTSRQGAGRAVVRWLFSEQPGTEEGLLAGATFTYLHDVTLDPTASTGMAAHAEQRILYVIAGDGMLHHRPNDGSPIVTRPLRPGDAALIRAGEHHRIANVSEKVLRLLILGLTLPPLVSCSSPPVPCPDS